MTLQGVYDEVISHEQLPQDFARGGDERRR